MNQLEKYNFHHIYEYVDLIDKYVKAEEGFWNYNEDYFITSAVRFSKFTLLHLYIVTTALNYYSKEFRKNSDCMDSQKWISKFHSYSIDIEMFDFENGDLDYVEQWFEDNLEKFTELFFKISEEVFYILFSNRTFLLTFCNIAALELKDIDIPTEFLTSKGTIKRTMIPSWVKKAVYHRDKGRCVFCNTDLTGVINTLSNHNYDHIVPLDLYGPNDPCNIQLTCESCNKKKNNKSGITTNKYIPWWPK